MTAHKTQLDTKEIVYDAVLELYNQQQTVTRETLAEHMTLALGIIDDRLKVLRNEGLIASVQRGVYVPVKTHPASRPVSVTELPDGEVQAEVGDDLMKLTPKEARTLASLLMGKAAQVSQIEAGQQAAIVVAEMTVRMRALERRLKSLQARQSNSQQQDLFAEEVQP